MIVCPVGAQKQAGSDATFRYPAEAAAFSQGVVGSAHNPATEPSRRGVLAALFGPFSSERPLSEIEIARADFAKTWDGYVLLLSRSKRGREACGQASQGQKHDCERGGRTLEDEY